MKTQKEQELEQSQTIDESLIIDVVDAETQVDCEEMVNSCTQTETPKKLDTDTKVTVRGMVNSSMQTEKLQTSEKTVHTEVTETAHTCTQKEEKLSVADDHQQYIDQYQSKDLDYVTILTEVEDTDTNSPADIKTNLPPHSFPRHLECNAPLASLDRRMGTLIQQLELDRRNNTRLLQEKNTRVGHNI